MKIVICNFPPMLRWYLPAAPAILSGASDWLGIESKVLDFNLHSDQTVHQWASLVVNEKPDLVSMSIFSYLSRPYAEQLAKAIKEQAPHIWIVTGGAGIRDSINGEIKVDMLNFDDYIDGDGELTWPKYMIDFFKLDRICEFDGINTPYFANFNSYEIDRYEQEAQANNTKVWVPITGSRGCVRKCTFCEIHQHWNFTQRTPEHIVREIKNILEKFSNAHIHFTDSLINGSLPAFLSLCQQLKDIKESYPDFTWGGQFIVRNAKQCDHTYWKSIADAGASILEIGVETGSDRLRSEMKKNFLNEDLDSTLEYMTEYKIQCVLMLFVGYPTETIDDFNQTLDMLHRYKRYAGNTIAGIQAGWTATIHPGTPIYDSSVNNPRMILSKNVNIWFNKDNPSLTAKERLRRRKQLQETCHELGYHMSHDNHVSLAEVEEATTKYEKIFALIEKV